MEKNKWAYSQRHTKRWPKPEGVMPERWHHRTSWGSWKMVRVKAKAFKKPHRDQKQWRNKSQEQAMYCWQMTGQAFLLITSCFSSLLHKGEASPDCRSAAEIWLRENTIRTRRLWGSRLSWHSECNSKTQCAMGTEHPKSALVLRACYWLAYRKRGAK